MKKNSLNQNFVKMSTNPQTIKNYKIQLSDSKIPCYQHIQPPSPHHPVQNADQARYYPLGQSRPIKHPPTKAKLSSGGGI